LVIIVSSRRPTHQRKLLSVRIRWYTFHIYCIYCVSQKKCTNFETV